MNYSRAAIKEHKRLNEYTETRFCEMSKICRDEIEVLTEYEELICRVTVILGSCPPREVADRSVRDLLADIFDFLYVSRRLILEGYATTAFPLLRRAFECISLINYFILSPNKATEWDGGKQISNVEIRKYLDSHPMGESEKSMKDSYAFFSRATHPNRGYIPDRFLGEGNRSVLGAIGVPDPRVIAGYIYRLLELWFWFVVLISHYYRDMLHSADKTYINDYMKVAKKAKGVGEELIKNKRKLWERQHNERINSASKK